MGVSRIGYYRIVLEGKYDENAQSSSSCHRPREIQKRQHLLNSLHSNTFQLCALAAHTILLLKLWKLAPPTNKTTGREEKKTMLPHTPNNDPQRALSKNTDHIEFVENLINSASEEEKLNFSTYLKVKEYRTLET